MENRPKKPLLTHASGYEGTFDPIWLEPKRLPETRSTKVIKQAHMNVGKRTIVRLSPSRMFRRSLFRLTYICNALPQLVINKKSVSTFKDKFKEGLKHACATDFPDWGRLLISGVRKLGVNSLKSFFDADPRRE